LQQTAASTIVALPWGVGLIVRNACAAPDATADVAVATVIDLIIEQGVWVVLYSRCMEHGLMQRLLFFSAAVAASVAADFGVVDHVYFQR